MTASILVVDDDPNLLRMLRRGLLLAGYAVEAVEDFGEVRPLRHPPDE